jgi:Cof subfamily protein (haloacid dehalogenase superfamily)
VSVQHEIKLLAFDLDGTALGHDLVITDELKEVVAEAVARDVMVTIATGRMYRSALQFAKELNLDAPLICYQGAMVREISTGETIYHLPISHDLAREFISLARQREYHVNLYVDDHLYVEQLNDEARYYSELARVPAEAVGDLWEFLDRSERDPTKLVVITDEQRTPQALSDMQQKFGNRLYITRSNPRFTEALNPQCNKGTALASIAHSLGLVSARVMAIGDDHNDLPMLDYAGVSVAVANAGPIVRQRARHVTKGFGTDGVIEAIRHFILNQNGNGRSLN